MKQVIGKYDYRVSWSEEDEAFVARVTEFASLAAHGDSMEEALSELRSVVDDVVADLKAEGSYVPEPLSVRAYSGKLNVRMPVSMHRNLVVEAEREGVSLNQLINVKLAK